MHTVSILVIVLLLLGVMAALAGTLYFFQYTIVRKKQSFSLASGTGPENVNTGTDWSGYMPLIEERKAWLAAQDVEPCSVRSFDGLTLRGTLLPAETPTKRVVLCVHGYRSRSLSFAAPAPFLRQMGWNLLMVDNRAHGESDGRYVGFGTLDRRDCLVWLGWLCERFGPDAEIVLYGVSMGATTALLCAGDESLPPQVKTVVADCGFTSAWEVFRHVLRKDYHLPAFPVLHLGSLLCRRLAGYSLRECSTLESLRHARVPVLLLHGADDTFVPTQMSRENFEACSSRKELRVIPGAGHGAAYYADPAAYEKTIGEWFRSLGLIQTSEV